MRTHPAGFAPKFALFVMTCAAWAAASTLAATPTDAPTTTATGSLASAATTPPVTPSPPPPAAFASLPAIRDVVVSPGGKMLAWLDETQGEPRIILYDIAAKKIQRVMKLGDKMTYRWLGWNDDDTLLYTVSMTEVLPARDGAHTGPDITREIYRMFSTDVKEPTLRMMLKSDGDFAYVTSMRVLKLHPNKPHTIIVQSLDWELSAKREQIGTNIQGGRRSEGWVRVVYEVDTHTGKGTRLEIGDQYTAAWLVDHDGKVVGRTEWYPELQSFSVLAKRGGLWTEIYKTQTATPIDVLGLDNAGSALMSIEPDSDGRRKLWSLPLDGSARKVALEEPDQDVQGAFYDLVSDELQGVRVFGAQKDTIWFDKAEQQRQEMLRHSFARLRCVVVSESANKQLAAIRVDGAASPPVFYLVDLASHQATLVSEEYPDLAGVKLGDVTSFTYKAHDGTGIPAYLTTPPNASQLPLPLIVLPHGGPNSRDTGDEFEWLRQSLATRGYAVFQPQFRGSTGWGEAFERAGDRQWGLLMQDDITDGVHALIDKGQVDAHRICIVGFSYGSGYAGYTALAGAAFTPGLYKCAISVNGVSDLPRYLGFQTEVWGPYSDLVAYWREHLGNRNDTKVIDRSPIHAVDQITAPVLLLYSSGDSVVPANQSQGMAEALKNAGKNVQLIEIPDADHALSHTAARVRSLEEIDKFLHDHL